MVTARLARLLLALAGFVLIAGALPAHAQAGVAGQPLGACVLRDTGQRAEELIRHPERFDCTTTQYKLGPGTYWAISRDIGQVSRPDRPLVLRFASLWQGGLTLHLLYGDGTIRSSTTDRRGITPFIQMGAIAEQPIPVAEAPAVRALWHVQDAANVRGVMMGVLLATAHESATANMAMAALYACFAGMGLALIVYNFALWCAMRHRFQLHYCALLAALMAYTLSSSGALAWVAPMVANNDRLRFNYLFLGLAGGAAAMFTRSFFEDRIASRWLDRSTRAVAAMVPLSGIVVFLFGAINLRLADAFYTLTILGLIAIVLPTLWQAWLQRSNFLWLFAIAWSGPIALAILRIMANLHVIGWSFWLDNSTVVSMMFEALTSALAVAYRIKFLRDERDEAITREVLARRLADTDPLTGLLNRRAFLDQAIGRPGEQQLLIADLDHFKRVNETLGHDGGDEVLRNFSRMLRGIVPANALVARLGGEEFAILSHAGEAVEPNAVLARLRAARMPFDLKVTASIGVCLGPLTSDVDWKALYRGADSALFEAKSAGRDRARHTARRAA
ncbi:diguanylate cyclase [Sphingomonas sp. dw_22]|uniref:sensor domain-containing diguanylate cyclase n=1 Tax=Sphingomonas sp. dw_22 TaxID=2721175 RepID=UPI001BD4C56F|nr:diguanylate cyclase [Sphingomonas sp. dw_22]